MMEKRNFVTPIRSSRVSDFGDELAESTAGLFGGGNSSKNEKKASSKALSADFTEKLSLEDEKTDILG